jgi:shikimate kinase
MSRNIILVGPMGAGKSTIGRLLADTLKLDFFDTDRQIEARTGANIPWIFDVEGEEGFRQREQEVLQSLCSQDRCVIATGGGTVLLPENRKLLRQSGWVLYLQVTVDQQIERTVKDKNRPLLQTENPRAILETLAEERNALYQDVSDMIVETDAQHPKEVVRQLIHQLSALSDGYFT